MSIWTEQLKQLFDRFIELSSLHAILKNSFERLERDVKDLSSSYDQKYRELVELNTQLRERVTKLETNLEASIRSSVSSAVEGLTEQNTKLRERVTKLEASFDAAIRAAMKDAVNQYVRDYANEHGTVPTNFLIDQKSI